MPSSILFWDVDTQADFLYPDGKLYVPGAEFIIPKLKELTGWANRNGMLIIASACAHRIGDPELQQYPPHCLVGTPGQQKIPETQLANALIFPNRCVKLPQNLMAYPQIIFEKQQLDVFSNPNIDEVLSRLEADRDIVLYGVVTEVCVAITARELMRRGYRLRVVTDAIRHIEQTRAESFLDDFHKSGGTLTTVKELLRDMRRLAA